MKWDEERQRQSCDRPVISSCSFLSPPHSPLFSHLSYKEVNTWGCSKFSTSGFKGHLCIPSRLPQQLFPPWPASLRRQLSTHWVAFPGLCVVLQRGADLSKLPLCGTFYLFEPKAAFLLCTSGGPEAVIALPLQKGVSLPETKRMGKRKGSFASWTPGH